MALKLQQHSDSPFVTKIGKHSLKGRYIRTCRVLPRAKLREHENATTPFLESKMPTIASGARIAFEGGDDIANVMTESAAPGMVANNTELLSCSENVFNKF